MTAWPSSTTRSRISRAETLIAFLLLALVTACGGKDKEADKPEPSTQKEMEETIVKLHIRNEKYEQWRKDFAAEAFLQNTATGKLLDQRGALVKNRRFEIAKLSQYHEKAKAEGISADDQLAAQKQSLDALEAAMTAVEKEQKIVSQWYVRDGHRFREVWEAMISANRTSKTFLDAGIKDVDGLAMLRDHSGRLRNARRYWTDELANAMIGAEVEGKMVDMARGTRESIAKTLLPLKKSYDIALSQLNSLKSSPRSIQGRIDWAAETLARADASDPWRETAAAKLEGFRKELSAFQKAAEEAAQTALDDGVEARRKRGEVLQSGNDLLKRINMTFIPEAQKRRWPLPQLVKK